MTPRAAAALSDIAPFMRALVRSLQATFGYELLSGALVWSDELPDRRVRMQVKDWTVVHFVLRFRTTLILREPEEQHREFWDEAYRLFPE